ncbi:MAG: hypothetical protein K2Y25_12235 [Pseudomonadaceae bacterium]|nr:hypothetical protein [Pseudomonadaceae bacterium]
MTLQRLIYALALIALLWLGRAILQGPQPLPLTSSDGSLQLADYRIIPLEGFNLEARVLGREDYHFDRGAALSPTDLALGWGPMAELPVLDKISISQSNRWYHWRADELPIPRREIEMHSANMHMIPANSTVAATLARVKTGQRIQLSGQLVRIEGQDGFTWSSSLSREDTGAGACELIWVEQLNLLE